MNNKKLMGTFAVRFMLALTTFGIFILSSRYLGAEGRGTISLFIANVTIVQLFSELIFGSGYIYFINHYKNSTVIRYGFIWSTLAGIIIPLLLYALQLQPEIYLLDLIINSTLFAWVSWIGLHLRAQKHFNYYNIFYLVYAFLQISIIWYIMFYQPSIGSYIFGLQMHLILCFIIGIVFILAIPKSTIQSNNTDIHWWQLIKKSSISQYSNWLFFLNTRVSYYLIFLFLKDNQLLGIYSAASVLTESIWIIPFALATPLYPIISSETNKGKIINLTNEYAYTSFWMSLFAMLFLLCIPETIFERILGKDFDGIHTFLLILAIGTVLLSYAKIYWNYFQGMGLFTINAKASLISFLIPFLCILPFLNYLNAFGIAIITSAGYLIYCFTLFFYYKKETKTSWTTLLLPPFRLFPKMNGL
jgi:O-antigen/teichoic acid export membrane protein